MKLVINFILLLFLTTEKIFSQDALVKIDSLPAQGILLDKGWKFHAGDDTGWAKLNFDERNWSKFDPSIDIKKTAFRQSDIGWFRLRFEVDSILFAKNTALIISQVGASEIYLDGNLLYKFGVVNKEYSKEKTYNLRERPFIFQLQQKAKHVIAVRYSFNKQNFLINYIYPNPCLKLILKEPNHIFKDYNKPDLDSFTDLFLFPLFLILALLNLFFYYSFRKDKAYLFLGSFCILFNANIILSYLSRLQTSTSYSSFLHFSANITSLIATILIYEAFYLFFQIKKPWYYFLIIVYAILILPSFFFLYDISNLFALLFYPITQLEFLRFSIIASRRKRSGAKIVASLLIAFYLFFIGFIILNAFGVYNIALILNTIAVFTIPIGITVFMAGEFATTGWSLQRRIKEVETLSKKVVAEEQEKQQILSLQKEKLEVQVQQRTSELKESLENLKSTQAQLIQSEKMASLGELTAGIAHEIQNPLNFVNNFSEVNSEMIDEAEEEIVKGNYNEVKNILTDIKDNSQKINHHGKRADAIVKGMLQHSRSSSGQKELVDINKLADEYLRLAYHGLRAKDKSFNAKFETDFDKSIGKINIVAQDIGRVILNLINNAFYAVSEKRKSESGNFEPVVIISTRKTNGTVEISVKDNGNGIPQKILDKIFQPFFTTKPTGQGTGLGLSLSYDIVKAHGGEIKVETKQGEGTEFIIELPTN